MDAGTKQLADILMVTECWRYLTTKEATFGRKSSGKDCCLIWNT